MSLRGAGRAWRRRDGRAFVGVVWVGRRVVWVVWVRRTETAHAHAATAAAAVHRATNLLLDVVIYLREDHDQTGGLRGRQQVARLRDHAALDGLDALLVGEQAVDEVVQ